MKQPLTKEGEASKRFSISAEVARKFRVWFERNLAGFRSGVVGDVEYRRAGELDDRLGDDCWYANAYDRAVLDYTESTTPAEDEFILSHPFIVLQLLLGLTDLRGVRCLRRGFTRRINSLQQKSYRSRYYEKDNQRRRILAAQRRKIKRRKTLNPCPTPEELRAAFAARNDSVEARIRFGGMVHDLECYVDNCLRINDEGEIIGRNGGIKQWLSINVPELYFHYKTVMRYKALAKRLRQAVLVSDPVPTSDLLEDQVVPTVQQDIAAGRRKTPANEAGKADGEVQVGEWGRSCGMCDSNERAERWEQVVIVKGVAKVMTLAEWRTYYYALKSHKRNRELARGRVKGIFEDCANTVASAFRVVDDYLDKHFDEFGCFVAKKVETESTVGASVSAGMGVNGNTGVPWGRKSDAYIRADGTRLLAKTIGKSRHSKS